MMPPTPIISTLFANSMASMELTSSQPFTATLPSFASMPINILPGNLLHASMTNWPFSIAEVPMITLLMPAEISLSTVVMSLMPPPTSITIFTAFLISRMREKFFWLPVKAPSRSTTCSTFAPQASHFFAVAEGSPE
jgi:hypothetical protein